VHEASPTDNYLTFGFDYSSLGIPEAPNTPAGAASTSGLQMVVNRDSGASNGASVYPTGQSFSGKYVFQFDAWMNTYGPFPGGGAGSTEFGGGFIGFDPGAANPRSGAGLLISNEGQSSNDWRFYANDEFQLYSSHENTLGENDLYSDNLTSGNAQPNPYLETIFPGQQPPATQQGAYPSAQTGTLVDGTLGFRWSTYKFDVDTVNGTAAVTVTDAATDVVAEVGTFTYDNTYVSPATSDTKILTNFEGNVALTYFDLFSSLVDEEAIPYVFGLFDNVSVYEPIPEPNAALLGTLGGAILLAWRRKTANR